MKNAKYIALKILNIILFVGIIAPMAYFLYRFAVVLIDRLDVTSGFVSAVFSAWVTLSGLFLKLLIVSAFFAAIKILTVVPSLLRRIKLYHRGTDVKEISLADDIESLINIDTESFVQLYKAVMYDAEKVAALLPVVLYAVASDNADAEAILSLMMNRDAEANDAINEFENMKKQMDGKVHIPLSYYTSTTPENGYQVQGVPVTRVKNANSSLDSREEKTLYIACSGSGSYRPIKLKALSPRNIKKSSNAYMRTLNPDDTVWVLDEFSSTLVNVKTK